MIIINDSDSCDNIVNDGIIDVDGDDDVTPIALLFESWKALL